MSRRIGSPRGAQHLLVERDVAVVGRERLGARGAGAAASAGSRSRPAGRRSRAALARAIASSSSSWCSRWRHWSPGSGRGGRFSSRFQRPSSDWNCVGADRARARRAPPATGPRSSSDQVELDLDPGHRLVTGERVLAQHDGERVEAALHLRPVVLPIASTERGPVDVLAHACAASLTPACPELAMLAASRPRRRPRRTRLSTVTQRGDPAATADRMTGAGTTGRRPATIARRGHHHVGRRLRPTRASTTSATSPRPIAARTGPAGAGW